jgi:hypothetical protein
LSLSIERQLPRQIVVDATGFLNFGHNVFHTRNLNKQDANLSTRTRPLCRQTSPILSTNTWFNPIPRTNTQSGDGERPQLVESIRQYARLFEVGRPGFRERYQSVQLQAHRPFASGFNLLFGYAYIPERLDTYFNDLENYFDRPAFQESAQPRHRISTAGTYQLPFGRAAN